MLCVVIFVPDADAHFAPFTYQKPSTAGLLVCVDVVAVVGGKKNAKRRPFIVQYDQEAEEEEEE